MKLFYLDDAQDLLTQYRIWLPKNGDWEVTTESDPNAALKHLESETYDIYLIDFQLFPVDAAPSHSLENAAVVHTKLKESNKIPATSPVVYVSGKILGKRFTPGEIWRPDYDHYLLCRPEDMKALDRALKNIHAHHQRKPETSADSPIKP